MPTKIIVPLLGEGVEEVTIVKWLKTEGDTIEEYDGVVEVETDKVVTEIPSPTDGTLLKILFPAEGETVPVGTLLAWIGEPGESIELAIDGLSDLIEPPPEPLINLRGQPEVDPFLHQKTSPDQRTQTASLHKPGRNPALGFISPVVSQIANETGIDLSKVRGTGLDSRITKKDVLDFIESSSKILGISGVSSGAHQQGQSGTILPLSTVRKRIAEHMIMSKHTSAHVTTLMEVDLSRVVAHRLENRGSFLDQGARLTFTAYFVAAVVAALKRFPTVNSSWSDQGLLLHKGINIGMATDLGDAGLIVPVIKAADDLSLLGIAKTVNDLANRARSKQLNPGDVKGATFSITNHGVSGSLLATPIINQPQCGILGIGAIQKRVVVVTDEFGNDTIAIRPMVYLTLTFDHRILDGAEADHFLAKVVKSLENW